MKALLLDADKQNEDARLLSEKEEKARQDDPFLDNIRRHSSLDVRRAIEDLRKAMKVLAPSTD